MTGISPDTYDVCPTHPDSRWEESSQWLGLLWIANLRSGPSAWALSTMRERTAGTARKVTIMFCRMSDNLPGDTKVVAPARPNDFRHKPWQLKVNQSFQFLQSTLTSPLKILCSRVRVIIQPSHVGLPNKGYVFARLSHILDSGGHRVHRGCGPSLANRDQLTPVLVALLQPLLLLLPPGFSSQFSHLFAKIHDTLSFDRSNHGVRNQDSFCVSAFAWCANTCECRFLSAIVELLQYRPGQQLEVTYNCFAPSVVSVVALCSTAGFSTGRAVVSVAATGAGWLRTRLSPSSRSRPEPWDWPAGQQETTEKSTEDKSRSCVHYRHASSKAVSAKSHSAHATRIAPLGLVTTTLITARTVCGLFRFASVVSSKTCT